MGSAISGTVNAVPHMVFSVVTAKPAYLNTPGRRQIDRHIAGKQRLGAGPAALGIGAGLTPADEQGKDIVDTDGQHQ